MSALMDVGPLLEHWVGRTAKLHLGSLERAPLLITREVGLDTVTCPH